MSKEQELAQLLLSLDISTRLTLLLLAKTCDEDTINHFFDVTDGLISCSGQYKPNDIEVAIELHRKATLELMSQLQEMSPN